MAKLATTTRSTRASLKSSVSVKPKPKVSIKPKVLLEKKETKIKQTQKKQIQKKSIQSKPTKKSPEAPSRPATIDLSKASFDKLVKKFQIIVKDMTETIIDSVVKKVIEQLDQRENKEDDNMQVEILDDESQQEEQSPNPEEEARTQSEEKFERSQSPKSIEEEEKFESSQSPKSIEEVHVEGSQNGVEQNIEEVDIVNVEKVQGGHIEHDQKTLHDDVVESLAEEVEM